MAKQSKMDDFGTVSFWLSEVCKGAKFHGKLLAAKLLAGQPYRTGKLLAVGGVGEAALTGMVSFWLLSFWLLSFWLYSLIGLVPLGAWGKHFLPDLHRLAHFLIDSHTGRQRAPTYIGFSFSIKESVHSKIRKP